MSIAPCLSRIFVITVESGQRRCIRVIYFIEQIFAPGKSMISEGGLGNSLPVALFNERRFNSRSCGWIRDRFGFDHRTAAPVQRPIIAESIPGEFVGFQI